MSRLLVLLAAFSVHRPPAGANPLTRFTLPQPERLSGCIEERIQAGGYLYLRITDASGAQHWVATLTRSAPKGSCVEAIVFARADQFHSSRLDRDFSDLSFASLKESTP